jgi:hypothetical protein
VARGALRTGDGEHPGLELVQETARPILRGETQVMLREDGPVVRASAPRSTRGAPPAPPRAISAQEGDLFEALRTWRTEIARAQSVPPYVIFHDTRDQRRRQLQARPLRRGPPEAAGDVPGGRLRPLASSLAFVSTFVDHTRCGSSGMRQNDLATLRR